MPVSRLKDIPGIGVDRMGDLADAAADPELLRLENLDTDIRPPGAALAASRRALEDDAANSYLPFLGQWPLRKAAVAHVARLSSVDYGGPEACVVTAGGLSGILNCLLARLEPGDRVLLPAPICAGLINRVRLAGGVSRSSCRRIRRRPAGGSTAAPSAPWPGRACGSCWR